MACSLATVDAGLMMPSMSYRAGLSPGAVSPFHAVTPVPISRGLDRFSGWLSSHLPPVSSAGCHTVRWCAAGVAVAGATVAAVVAWAGGASAPAATARAAALVSAVSVHDRAIVVTSGGSYGDQAVRRAGKDSAAKTMTLLT